MTDDKTYYFDDFTVGESLGSDEQTLQRGDLEKWFALFPEDENGDTMPTGMVASVMMQSYARLIPRRPPGGMHGSQKFELQQMPVVGDRIVTEIKCVDKTIKSERRWLTLEMTSRRANGAPLWVGRMLAIWAA